MAARKIRLWCSAIWLSIQIPSNSVLIGTFPSIGRNKIENSIEKREIWAKAQMKGVPKGVLHIRKCPFGHFRKFVKTVGYDEFVGITKYNWRKLQ